MKTKCYYILAFIVVVVAGFVVYSRTQQIEKPSVVQNTVIAPTDKESCETRGGKWEIWRDMPEATPECNLPTADGGEECADSSQCESYCQAPRGTEIGVKIVGECYRFEIAVCMQEVNDGVASAEWCH
jgi:hypothetical protein